MLDSLELSITLPVKASKIYKAWLSGKLHSQFTGSKATVNPKIGCRFTAWDWYIEGKTLELIPGKKIVQSWRTTDFSEQDIDSKIEIILEESNGETKLTLIHTNIPEGQGENYKKGWFDFYFKPMQNFFK